ncbi:MAG: hypothetical protein JO247_15710 [Chloroflexi bacterium]|nr:hypothetical protein [Chloroflexota bacterium]
MSREAVNQIIDRAVADDSFFELLRSDPEQATQGYELEPFEVSAFRARAYNVVVRATRREREERAAIEASRAELAARRAAPPPLVSTPTPPSPRAPIAGLVGFLAGLLVIAGGLGGFKYFEGQWPWEALNLVRQPTAAGSIPSPTLGARPKPSASAAAVAGGSARAGASDTAAGASGSATGAGVSANRATPTTTSSGTASAPGGSSAAAATNGAGAAASPSSSAGNGQAALRPSPSAGASAAPSASAGADVAAEKAYYDAVGARLAKVISSYGGVLVDFRAGSDPTTDLTDLSSSLADLAQHLNDAPPLDALKAEHQTLSQAIPLLQGDADQLKLAANQKNGTQAALIAVEMQAVFAQLPDEIQFATVPHADFYQPVDSSQQLSHILQFDVVSQNLTAGNNSPPTVQVRIGLNTPTLSNDQVSDTLRHSVVAARQTYPQAGQVHVTAYKETNGSLGQQVGSADWYCSPSSQPPGSTASWQDACSKIFVTLPGSNPAQFPY